MNRYSFATPICFVWANGMKTQGAKAEVALAFTVFQDLWGNFLEHFEVSVFEIWSV